MCNSIMCSIDEVKVGSLKANARLVVNQSARRDPTQTTTLRNQFASAIARRFAWLRGQIWRAIVIDDVFGLRNNEVITANKEIKTNQSPGRRAFAFTSSSQKVAAFMEWIDRMVRDGILEVSDIAQVGASVDSAWTNKYVTDSYRRGVNRARMQMKQAGYSIPIMEGGLNALLSAPVHLDRLGLLYTRVFTELKGITDSMDTAISRVLSQGIADGLGAETLARQLNNTIKAGGGQLGITDSLGRYIPAERRAKLLARTEVIRAHAEGQLQEFENLGAIGVGVMAEWITAGDNRVCPQCASLEGNIYTIVEARGKLPLHPGCRCAWIPTQPN